MCVLPYKNIHISSSWTDSATRQQSTQNNQMTKFTGKRSSQSESSLGHILFTAINHVFVDIYRITEFFSRK